MTTTPPSAEEMARRREVANNLRFPGLLAVVGGFGLLFGGIIFVGPEPEAAVMFTLIISLGLGMLMRGDSVIRDGR